MKDWFTFEIPTDERGFYGRRCPEAACRGYFKVAEKTGITDATDGFCAYCGHLASAEEFVTQEQLDYLTSLVGREIFDDVLRTLKSTEVNYPPQGPFGIGFKITVQGFPEPIRHYIEQELETELTCEKCTLRYAIFGVFAFCPGCGTHNSLQIFEKNLDLIRTQLALADDPKLNRELAGRFVVDTLQNAVNVFDGFGREIFKVHAELVRGATQTGSLSFQNISAARKVMLRLFGFDLAESVGQAEWELVCRSFQKRHVFTHRMGVVDQAYVDNTKDTAAVVGRKIQVRAEEVAQTVSALRKIAKHCSSTLSRLRDERLRS